MLAAGSMASVSRLPVNDAGASGSLAPGHAYHRNPHTGHRALEKPRNCLILPMRDFLLKAYTLHFMFLGSVLRFEQRKDAHIHMGCPCDSQGQPTASV